LQTAETICQSPAVSDPESFFKKHWGD